MDSLNIFTSNQMIKSINEQKVLRIIFKDGPISRVDLSEKTGLTQQTITNIARRLLEKDIIVELNPTSQMVGRKPIPLQINGENLYGIGIEIAVKYVRGTLMDFSGKKIHELDVKVPTHKKPEHPMHYIYQVIDELFSYVPDPSRLKGIGCSIQGLVNVENGEVIYSPGLQWNQFPLREKLEARYNLPIFVENDVNLLSLSQNLNGVLDRSTDNISLKFDHGIGSAFVFNKKLIQGSTHVAGELGHYKAFTGSDAKLCHCGSKGCLTTYASVSGLLRNSEFTLESFVEGVNKQSKDALWLYNKIVLAITKATSNLITILNPDHILFTGKLLDCLKEMLIPELRKEIIQNIPKPCRDVKILYLPETPNESVLAVGLVMDQFFSIPAYS